MRIIFIIFVGVFILPVKLHAQTRQYAYYMNDQMEIVPKQEATIVGRGMQRDSIFVIQFYTIPDNRLFLIEMFKDSTLNVLHGNRILYHPNRKKAEHLFYKDNMLHGPSVKWDSLGRLTDSAMYYENMPVYLVKYSYDNNNHPEIVHEFGNASPKKWPDERSVVVTVDGNMLSYELWKNLMYSSRYAFRQDKVSPNKYLIYRFSDDYFNKLIAKDPRPEESKFFKTGQSFSINEVDINGNRLRSKDLKSTVLVINYWFIGCPPCRREIPDLNELVEEYKDSANVKFIGIALDDRASLKDFLKQIPFKYQIVAEGEHSAQQYGVHLFPTHVIVDGDGKVYFHTVSSPRQLFYWMRKSINELLEKQRQKPQS